MKRWEPIAYPGPDNVHGAATHRNFNQGTGARGSWPDAEGYQQNVIDEPASLVELSGFTLDPNDPLQMSRAVRSQRLNFVAAAAVAGTANAITLAFDPTFASLADMVATPIRFVTEAANTTAVTVKPDALAAVPLVWPDGTALAAGDLPIGRIVEITYDGTKFVLLLGGSQAAQVVNAYIAGGRPPQAAPFFLATGAVVAGIYASNVATTSSDMVLSDSQFLDPGTTFVGGVLTIGPKDAGVWQFQTNLGINSAFTGWTSKVSIIKNLSFIFGFAEMPCYGTAVTGIQCAPGNVRLAAGDTVRPQMLQNTGGPQASSPLGRFSGSRIGV